MSHYDQEAAYDRLCTDSMPTYECACGCEHESDECPRCGLTPAELSTNSPEHVGDEYLAQPSVLELDALNRDRAALSAARGEGGAS